MPSQYTRYMYIKAFNILQQPDRVLLHRVVLRGEQALGLRAERIFQKSVLLKNPFCPQA